MVPVGQFAGRINTSGSWRAARVAAWLSLLTSATVGCGGQANVAPVPGNTAGAPGGTSGSCPEGMKACPGPDGVTTQCVSKGDPQTGCGEASCAACALAHASMRCGPTLQCEFLSCIPPYSDCNRDPADGCEANTATDEKHCGVACLGCEAPGIVGSVCASGLCKVASCFPGRADCNQEYADGCEIDLATSPAHCGRCGNPCGTGRACAGGVCQ